MRLDKFLKVSRIIKRRTIANEACDGGKISVNGKIAKASLNLNIGDVIEIRFKNQTMKVKVLSLTESIRKEDSSSMYQIIEGDK